MNNGKLKDTELRIYHDVLEHLAAPVQIESFDFTTSGLITQPTTYGIGGIKDNQEYWNEDGEWVVRKRFKYFTTGLQLTFEWADLKGNVGLSKVEFKPLNFVEVAKIEKANRDRTMIYFQASAKGTPVESFVNAILKHYKEQIDLWIYNNTSDWLDAIESEPKNSEIYQYLNIPLKESFTVKDSIKLQIQNSEIKDVFKKK